MQNKYWLKTECKCKRAYINPLSGICSLCWNEIYPYEKDEIKEEDLLEPKQETLAEVETSQLQNKCFCETIKDKGEMVNFLIVNALKLDDESYQALMDKLNERII